MLCNRFQRIYASRVLTCIRPRPFSDRCINTLCAGDSSCSTCVAGSYWSGTGLDSLIFLQGPARALARLNRQGQCSGPAISNPSSVEVVPQNHSCYCARSLFEFCREMILPCYGTGNDFNVMELLPIVQALSQRTYAASVRQAPTLAQVLGSDINTINTTASIVI